MRQKRVIGCGQLCAASLFFVSGAIASLSDCTLAQIIPDATLPVNSVVRPSLDTSIIEGGTASGGNLFHSFKEFSVPTGGTAFFNNALNIQNIFTRITGSSISHIDGLIRANGTANLFLLNPNGIIFGPNAQLNIGGSFIGSTANSIKFTDDAEFSAVNPQITPLLAVNVPIGLQMGASPGTIINQSRVTDNNGKILGLSLLPGKTFGLIGGDITLDGGYLTVPQGRIVLASVSDNRFVGFTQTETGITFNYSGIDSSQNLHLSQQAAVDVSGIGGGEVQLVGGQVQLTEASRIIANTLGNQNGGDVFIKAEKLTMQDGAFISTATLGEGKAGNFTVIATDSIELTGTSDLIATLEKLLTKKFITSDIGDGIFTTSFSSGTAGDLTVETKQLIVRNGAQVSTATLGNGLGGNLTVRTPGGSIEVIGGLLLTGTAGRQAAGDLIITTRSLKVRDGGVITTTTLGEGKGGNITINASDLVEIDSKNQTPVITALPATKVTIGLGLSSIISSTYGSERAGNLTINTEQLIARDDGQVTTVTFGEGRAGNLTINAVESVKLSGHPIHGFITGLSTETDGSGASGDLTINTRRLIVRDGAQIIAATSGSGAGGNLTVNASEAVELIGTNNQDISGLFVSGQYLQLDGSVVTGGAGNLRVNTERLIVRDGARITASNMGVGKAGNVEIIAPFIQLNNEGTIRATTRVGDRGNITIQSQNLQMRHESNITTDGSNTANGGNITINTDVLAALENSNIRANAIRGQGGNILINTQGDFRSFDSEVSASSQLGINGVVEIQTPDTNPIQALLNLPQKVIAPPPLAQDCRARGSQTSDRFINSGKGGVPPNPSEPLSSNIGWVDSSTGESNLSNHKNYSSFPERIVEAQGWIINANGVVELTASPPTVMPNNSGFKLPACN